MSRDIGQIINGLGVTADTLADDTLVSDALVLMKCIAPDGGVTLLLAHSDGMSWIERLGMLHVAVGCETQGGWRNNDDDD